MPDKAAKGAKWICKEQTQDQQKPKVNTKLDGLQLLWTIYILQSYSPNHFQYNEREII